jgi:hypothetical protein
MFSWMQVEMEWPSTYCSSEDEVVRRFHVNPRRELLWIDFLDKRQGLRIFYYTREC